jgi:hypothetical protein
MRIRFFNKESMDNLGFEGKYYLLNQNGALFELVFGF